jgi:tetratricopeptide (TPR) repeat protein
MRHAIALETTRALITGARPQSLKSEAVKSLVRDELSMLLAAHADEIAAREADDVLARYGATDWLCAWAHLARATVLHRKGNDPQSASEFDAAFRTAEAGGNLGRADAILQAIAFEAGPDEALRRIQSHGTASHPDADGLKPPAIVSDPRWDFIRVDLLQNNHRFAEAAQELDRMLPRLADLSSADQIDLLRRATVVYISQRVPQTEKAEAACLALIERKPDDLWALNNMAMFYIEQSHPPDPSQAVTYGRRAYDVMNKSGDIDPRIADTYGWTLLANGSASEAIAVLVPAVERLPIPEIQYHLAEAYLAIGQGSAAWAQLVPAVREIQQGNVAGNETDSKLQQRIADALYRAALMAW